MKKIKLKKMDQLKLNQLSKSELDGRAKNVLKGGSSACKCQGYNYWNNGNPG